MISTLIAHILLLLSLPVQFFVHLFLHLQLKTRRGKVTSFSADFLKMLTTQKNEKYVNLQCLTCICMCIPYHIFMFSGMHLYM